METWSTKQAAMSAHPDSAAGLVLEGYVIISSLVMHAWKGNTHQEFPNYGKLSEG